jgi:hypothetical protein
MNAFASYAYSTRSGEVVLVGLLALAALVSAKHASAADASRPYGVVICTSEAKGPWTLKARGTLTRTRSGTELVYRFESPGYGSNSPRHQRAAKASRQRVRFVNMQDRTRSRF